MTTAVNNTTNPYAALNAGSGSKADATSEAADRFLKLLVTQMQNQDPLNPMDNAQVTSQMAQISTVSGIEKLNVGIESMTSQFTQMQALQGASLVGRKVLLEGDTLAVANGKGAAGFELAGAADNVKVEILSPSGRVIDTLQLGAQSAGRHGFEWTANGVTDNSGLRFRVTATTGAVKVGTTPLVGDVVNAVSTAGDKLSLELLGGRTVAYSDIKAFS
ncbi:flagellar hook assembly protein FlgD [Methylibium rhizosphaerae]|jgi:flagellar basal-body rod modification protein FlgD|uniref:flagellar hook assembly protein FlgD n=1 Tax=Methylibium rhizosphaerae TaxID=2570323 RepID=UPI0011261248|nr:flagellar hook assembly protein FlgD [Methylibium rhizosphaerae]